MRFIITFLEGIISFISPCVLPMLPVYVTYFAAGEGGAKRTLCKALAFTGGFTLIFCALGLFAGSIGSVLTEHRTALNIVCGSLMIFFGLSFTGAVKLKLPGIASGYSPRDSVLSAFVFGIVFSVSLTPCVGAFLGSALALAAGSTNPLLGVLLLLTYSLGMAIPFAVSALLIGSLKRSFDFIKRHYGVINIVCGSLLIITGALMALGLLDILL